MGYSIDWYIENEVVYLKYWGVITPDDFRASMTEVQAMVMRSSRHLVHNIACVEDVTQPVHPMEALHIIRELGNPENMGWSIQIGLKSPIAKMGIGVATSIFKNRTRALDSFPEAVDFLKEVDANLSWDKANTLLAT